MERQRLKALKNLLVMFMRFYNSSWMNINSMLLIPSIFLENPMVRVYSIVCVTICVCLSIIYSWSLSSCYFK